MFPAFLAIHSNNCEIDHANNTFHLQVERVGFSSILRLMRPQAQYARMIQHLQFSIDLKIPKQDTEVIFFDSRSPWTFVFVPPADLENPLPCDHDTPIDAKFLAQRFRMHHDFSKLRSLKIYITAELPSDVTFYDFVRNRGRIERVCLCKGKAETLRTLGVGHLGFHTRSASLQLNLHCKTGACEERVGAVLRAILLRGA